MVNAIGFSDNDHTFGSAYPTITRACPSSAKTERVHPASPGVTDEPGAVDERSLSQYRYSYADGEAKLISHVSKSTRAKEYLQHTRVKTAQLVQLPIHFANVVAAYANILCFSRERQHLSLAEPRYTGERSPRRTDTIMRTAISHDAFAQGEKNTYIFTCSRFCETNPMWLTIVHPHRITPCGFRKHQEPRFDLSKLSPTKKPPPWRELLMFERPPRAAARNDSPTSSAEPGQRPPLAHPSLPAASSVRRAADG